MWYGMGRMYRDCGPRGGGRGGWEPRRWDALAEEITRSVLGGGGRRGGRRMFDGGELRLVLLKLIGDEPRHGYDLIREIEELTGGAYAPSPGVVYPTLTMLDEMGQIEEQASEGAKKRFAATEAGRAQLVEKADEVAALIARLEGIGEHRNRADQWPVRRAMGNLRLSVRGRMMQGSDDDTTQRIAALIDEVAQKIERLK